MVDVRETDLRGGGRANTGSPTFTKIVFNLRNLWTLILTAISHKSRTQNLSKMWKKLFLILLPLFDPIRCLIELDTYKEKLYVTVENDKDNGPHVHQTKAYQQQQHFSTSTELGWKPLLRTGSSQSPLSWWRLLLLSSYYFAALASQGTYNDLILISHDGHQ